MVYALLKYILFIVCFAVSMYACSGIQFEKFVKVKEPKKAIILLFIISMVLGSLLSQAILNLTIFNGFGM